MRSGFKTIAAAALLMGGLTAGGHANANGQCSLSISSQSIQVGEAFSYTLPIYESLPGPLPPPDYPFYQVYFYGMNPNGQWIGPEPAPTTLSVGGGTFTGYYNPGGIGGTYYRYAVVYSGSRFICVTNYIATYLYN
jgi:hypothetical protein